MKTAIIICSRIESKRVPRKPLVKFSGIPLIQHLVERLIPCGVPVILGVPHGTLEEYEFLHLKFKDKIKFMVGPEQDPLARMYLASLGAGLDAVIRITHDKMFVDTDSMLECLKLFEKGKYDYLYSSQFVCGSGFEIFSQKALEKAYLKFQGKNVEHISYAIRSVAEKQINLVRECEDPEARLLIDFPEDVEFFKTIFSFLPSDCTLKDVLGLLKKESWMYRINRRPRMTVYTCAHNAREWIERAIYSVVQQHGFKDTQYILIDDGSTDGTSQVMAKYASLYPNIKWIRNQVNLGLSSSSNIALDNATGQFIIRLDADDCFADRSALADLYTAIKYTGKDAVYPNYFLGDFGCVKLGKETHHPAGAIFSTRALNFIRFTDGLRGLDGHSLYQRAKDVLSIGYLDRPTFIYTQRENSLSRTDLKTREKIKAAIDGQKI